MALAGKIDPEKNHRDQEPAGGRPRPACRERTALSDEHAGGRKTPYATTSRAEPPVVRAVHETGAGQRSLKPSANVATVKNTPSAWTSSSFSMPDRPAGTAPTGITCTPDDAENHAGDEAYDAADPFLVAWRDAETEIWSGR